ncbi:MAG: paraquat-inducible protein A [bacterium]
MEVTTLGTPQADTIMSGVMHLLEHGSWPLALVVFFASVVVPLFKIIALLVLLISVQRRSMWRPVERTRLYRLTELLGRWSMVDIFVVTVLAALVQAGGPRGGARHGGRHVRGAVVVVP